MNFSLAERFGGVPNGDLYSIEDTAASEQEWRALISAFDETIGGGSTGSREDYEIPDWHHGMRGLFVYLYGERFYVRSFVPAVVRILKAQPQPCFAKSECFNDESRLIGCFLVFKDRVIFDECSEKSGLVARLMGDGQGLPRPFSRLEFFKVAL
jgi:hypothetical protein